MKPWTSQPQFAAGVDKSARLSRGLAMLTNFGASASDAVRGMPGAVESGASIGGTIYGLSLKPGAGPAGLKPGATTDANSFVSASEFTVMVLLRVNSLGTRRIFLGDFDTGGSSYGIEMEQTTANQWQLQLATTAPLAIPAAGGTVTVGWHWCELVFKQNVGAYAYVDGTLIASDVTTAMTRTRRPGVDYRIGRPGAYPGLPFDGDIAFHAAWSRQLLDSERAAVRANPWQLFAPLSRPWERPAPVSAATIKKFRSRTIFGTRAGSRSSG